jgi:hypothetical protein
MSSIMGLSLSNPTLPIDNVLGFNSSKTGRKTLALQDGCLNYIEDGDEVLIAGFGRKGPF